MAFISNIQVASKLDPQLVTDLEAFFPIWLEKLIPLYEQAKSGGDFAFHIMHTISFDNSILYFTVNGYDFYRKKHFYCGGYHTLLSFYGGNRYHMVDWKDDFKSRYGYELTLSDKINLMPYVSRFDNKKAPYDSLNNNLSDYFRILTNDPSVFISLGSWGTYIVLDKNIFWEHEASEVKWHLHF